jgi:hypothetical protein
MNRILIAAALSAMACGGAEPSTGGASIQGSIAGLSMNKPIDVVSSAIVSSCGGTSSSALQILISDTGGRCAAMQSGKIAPRSTSIVVELISPDGSPFAPGTYAIAAGSVSAVGQKAQPLAFVGIGAVDQVCSATQAIYATAGSVTIDSVQGNAVSGSFTAAGFQDNSNLRSADGSGAETGTLTGSFSASGCAVPPVDCSAIQTTACE